MRSRSSSARLIAVGSLSGKCSAGAAAAGVGAAPIGAALNVSIAALRAAQTIATFAAAPRFKKRLLFTLQLTHCTAKYLRVERNIPTTTTGSCREHGGMAPAFCALLADLNIVD